VVKANDDDVINELASVDLSFVYTSAPVNGGNIAFEVAPADDFTMTRYENTNRYMFNYNGVAAFEDTANAITIGTIKVTGYGAYTIATDASDEAKATNIVNATTINDNLVFIYAQDAEVMGGTFGEAHGRKIVELYKHAIKAKAPIIGLLDCAGFRIEEGMDGLHQFSKLYKTQAKAWNQIPQIMAVTGQCGGGMSIAAELSDFVFIEEGKGSIFVNPQGVVSNAIGNNPYVTAVDDGKYPWEEIIEKIRKLINLLPSSSDFTPEIKEVDFEVLTEAALKSKEWWAMQNPSLENCLMNTTSSN
jgi:hypothetical protein